MQQDGIITFKHENKDFCSVYQRNKISEITCNRNKLDSASILHELLHIWLNRLNCNVGTHIYLTFESNKVLGKIFNKYLCDRITNFCDHSKMYPEFLKYGIVLTNFYPIANSLKQR